METAWLLDPSIPLADVFKGYAETLARDFEPSGQEQDMRYRLDVVSPSVPEVVKFAGGWLVDRVMAGWDVTVLVDGAQDLRPLEILGVDTQDLRGRAGDWADRPHPQTVAVASELFSADARVRQGVLNALDQGLTEVTLWGEHWPEELDDTVGSVRAPAQCGSPRLQGPGARRDRSSPRGRR